MGRKTLQVYQHTNLRIMAAICCMLFFLPDVAFAAAETNDRLHRLLKNDMAFTAKEFNRFKAGETVTKILETDTQHEVGIFSIAKINVSKELFIRRYQEKLSDLQHRAATRERKGRTVSNALVAKINSATSPPSRRPSRRSKPICSGPIPSRGDRRPMSTKYWPL